MEVILHGVDSSEAQDDARTSSRTARNIRSRARKYMGCRLPIVSRRMQEMSQVKEFIEFAAERNVLSCSADDAMQICTDLIEEHRSGSSRSRTNPTSRTDDTTVCSNCHAPISDGLRFSVNQGSSLPSRGEQAIGEPQLDQEPSTADRLQERGTVDGNDVEDDNRSPRPSSSEEDYAWS